MKTDAREFALLSSDRGSGFLAWRNAARKAEKADSDVHWPLLGGASGRRARTLRARGI